MKLQVHKIASVVHRLGLGRTIEVMTERRVANDGDVVVVRAEAEKRVYGELELAEGRMAKIFRGDTIVGALGARRALKGFVGSRPHELGPGDRLAILNLGGVVGVPQISQHPDLGAPCPVECLGFVATDGAVATVASGALPEPPAVSLPPLIAVSGTCMASGKTRAACEIIHELAAGGKRVNAGKLTGVACRRDPLVMGDHGAQRTSSFLDFGLVSTVCVPDIARYGRMILHHLAADELDMIVVELGDGFLGEYGVREILKDLRDDLSAHVVCTTDPVGAWGANKLLAEDGIRLDVMSGPCTDSVVGSSFVETELGIPGVNACAEPRRLAETVIGIINRTDKNRTD